MAALTPATKTEIKGIGAHRMIIIRFTTCADNDTWASGLQTISKTPMFFTGGRGDPSTQASAGCNIDFNSTTGSVTFHPGENSLALDLLIVI